ncbi:KRI1-like family-domain-containing protein [Xylariales sp. AK1849]|nr:KRI1-like family-domain-containing protein [Xylariales sp. AK1849]
MAPHVSNKTTLFDSEDESDGGVQLKINDEYARRFEHNKKREERHRLEEKYKGQSNGKAVDHGEEELNSSDDETEDEDGYLATEELDAQLNATLEAIRKKDPRIYDGTTTFYAGADGSADDQPKAKKEKPIYLRDYHRERILAGDVGDDDKDEPPRTYAQEQNDLQKSIQDEIKAQFHTDAGDDQIESDGDDDFIKPKEGEVARVRTEVRENGMHPSRAAKVKATPVDPAIADKDPQLYLSNFMASRAWIQPEKSSWQAFESDEEDDDAKADADDWEAAYNLRFEDPNKSNEFLKSYARDIAAAKSVRREEKSGRKKQRELERERQEAEKQERRAERARLRKLKIEEAENKLKQIKKAAGLRGKNIKDGDFMKFLDDAWENDKWEEEMNKAFGDEYYAEEEGASGEEVAADSKSKKKVKKPKWDDDIDIKDLVPGFEEDEEEPPRAALSDLEAGSGEEEDADEDDEDGPARKRQKTAKERRKERLTSQKEARQERAKLEALVDAKMELDDPEVLASSSKSDPKGQPRFAYRETWAESYGLTSRDILMAPSDAALNEFVGLKKLAHFRPDDKKAKDKKRLGKKARLRQWRRETFGPEAEREGPAFSFGDAPREEEAAPEEESNTVDGGRKRKKRSRKNKSSA